MVVVLSQQSNCHLISTGPRPEEKIEGAEGLVAWARGQIAMSQVG